MWYLLRCVYSLGIILGGWNFAVDGGMQVREMFVII